jgi:hypothetical protein
LESTFSTTFSTSVRKKLSAGCCTATWVPVWPSRHHNRFAHRLRQRTVGYPDAERENYHQLVDNLQGFSERGVVSHEHSRNQVIGGKNTEAQRDSEDHIAHRQVECVHAQAEESKEAKLEDAYRAH